MKSMDIRRAGTKILPVAFLAGILLVWEVCGRAGLLNPLFFPVPSYIFMTSLTMLAEGEIQANLSITLIRVFAGFLIGAVTGLVVGVCMGVSERVRLFIDPVIAATYPIPKLAIFPLLMIIFGIGELSKIMVIAIGCFFIIVINTMAGVRNINRVYFEVAKNYGASRFKVFSRVVIPASLPMIFTSIRLAIGMSLILVVGVEFLSANKGLGAMIWFAWETFEIQKLYVGIFICALLGIFFTVVLKRLEEKAVPWFGYLAHQDQE
ncbi:MAG: ABC transporter permease [Methanoregulaceae archaeon]|nr:MAG: ABC transporter permease [Methanoregulaceae archaeon]